jgi:hypothetical protein
MTENVPRRDEVLLAAATMVVLFSAMLEPRVTMVLSVIVLVAWFIHRLIVDNLQQH